MFRAAAALLLGLATAATGAAPSPLPAALFDVGSRDPIDVPASFTKDGIVVPVAIAGKVFHFVLDSGSPNTVLDSRVARSLGLSATSSVTASFGGDYSVARSHVPDLTVGDLNASNVEVSIATFRRQASGFRTDGLLGVDFLSGGVAEIDFSKHVVTLHRSLPAGLRAAGWSPVPLRLEGGVPLIQAEFNGRAGLFIADLGADESMLFPPYFSQLHVAAPPGSYNGDTMFTLAGKPVPIKHFVVSRFALGDWIFGDAEVVVPFGPFAQGRDYDGLIGRNALSQLDLVIDFRNQSLWFRPIDNGRK